MKQEIYTMDLFENKIIRLSNEHNYGVMFRRVPGGWIVTEFEDAENSEKIWNVISSVFVPYNEEFKTKSKPDFTEPTIL